MKLLLGLWFALLLLTQTAYALSSWPINGQVLDEETGKPIADAIVVVTWQGDRWQVVQSSTTCYHVETARTDAEGKYHIPAWSSPWKVENLTVFNREVYADAYKPGYTWPVNLSNNPERVLLRSFKGTSKQRLEYLLNQIGKECGSRSDYAPKLVLLYKALYDEDKSIAVTLEDKEKVAGIHYSLDILDIGYEQAPEKMTKGAYKNE